jgi:hypothetical protein
VIDKLLATFIAAFLPNQASAQAQAEPPAADYAQDSSWLCLPGRNDICSTPLATTALNPNGYGSTGSSSDAKDPPLDSFYVYPTVSNDQGLNSDLNAGREEKLAVEAQFARFASVCRPFAPTYRQMTIGAIAAFSAGADISRAGRIAYGDVRAAWRNYLATKSNGRPFVLIGHSQGSLMLQQLIAREIEKDPALLKRMKLAIIPGYDVLVPQGKLVGGTFKTVPLCSRAAETSCVMSWTSYRNGMVPPEGALFGYAPLAGMTVGCVNPALPGSKAWEKLDSYWFTRSTYAVQGGPIAWSSEGAPPSPYLRAEGLASGKCVNDGQRGYLALRTNHAPDDKWTDRIGGEVSVLGIFLPGWGMHLADIAVAQGDLVRRVEAISARSRTAARR